MIHNWNLYSGAIFGSSYSLAWIPTTNENIIYSHHESGASYNYIVHRVLTLNDTTLTHYIYATHSYDGDVIDMSKINIEYTTGWQLNKSNQQYDYFAIG